MIDLNIKEIEGHIVGEYTRQPNQVVDKTTLGMALYNEIDGIIPIGVNDDVTTISYDLTDTVTLDEYFGDNVKRNQMLNALNDMAGSLLQCEKYLINTSYIVLDTSKVYVNKTTKKAYILVLPIKDAVQPVDTVNFFKQVLFAPLDPDDENEYVSKLMTSLNPRVYSLEGFKKEIEELLGEKPKEDANDDWDAEGKSIVEYAKARLEAVKAELKEIEDKEKAVHEEAEAKAKAKEEARKAEEEARAKEEARKAEEEAKAKEEARKAEEEAKTEEAEKEVVEETVEEAVEEKETAKAEETVTETATEEKTEEIADVEEVKAFLVREVIETDIEEGTEEKVEQEIPISKNEYVIGSSENADLVIDETEVFPEHARITMKNDEYFIKDLGSATGTFMNGADISQMDDEFPVINGSKIRIGQQEFKFVIK